MAETQRDGYCELAQNKDRTQVTATVYPPVGVGRAVTTQDILARIRELGVLYGIREDALRKAARYADECGAPAAKVLVAQGVLPVDGTDAQIMWRVDPLAASKPLPRRPDGLPDLFVPQPDRMATADQLLAAVFPARPGSPGKTVTAPLQVVHQAAGLDSTLVAGPGVRLSEDNLQFFAATDGCVELRHDTLMVHPIQWHEGDLEESRAFSTGIVVLGDMRKAGMVRSNGVVAVKGDMVSVTLRATGDVYINRAAHCTVVTQGYVYVFGCMLNCTVNSRRRVIALDGASIVGGTIVATEGVDAIDLGAPDTTPTQVRVGVDELSAYRLSEIQRELALCASGIRKIGEALLPMTAAATAAMSPDRRQLVQKLVDERRHLEDRMRRLHGEKRQCAVGIKELVPANVGVSGSVYPGVSISIGTASRNVADHTVGTLFVHSHDGRTVDVRPWRESRAA